MNKVNTIDLQGKAYARVADRIKAFREECPNGLIETTPTITDKHIIFKTRILKDKANATSGESTGHALGELKEKKSFEKLESISIGRALAILGYMASGEIASSEEMEEFHDYKNEKFIEMLDTSKKEIEAIKTLPELKAYYEKNRGKGKEFDEMVIRQKEKLTKTPNANS